jgi:2-amino-4-hydroxy-6-hydroxymethyldihydropteridine diphosphokinase
MNAFLGIGTNLGDREVNLQEVLVRIEESIGEILAVSSVYETEPWGFESKDWFLNMILFIRTDLKPSGLLGRLLIIEALMGRVRDEKDYKSRIIDIDILLYENETISEPGLTIPHPRLHKRRFVLVPLCEINPDGIHPVLKKSFASLLSECQDKSKVVLYNKPLSAKL